MQIEIKNENTTRLTRGNQHEILDSISLLCDNEITNRNAVPLVGAQRRGAHDASGSENPAYPKSPQNDFSVGRNDMTNDKPSRWTALCIDEDAKDKTSPFSRLDADKRAEAEEAMFNELPAASTKDEIRVWAHGYESRKQNDFAPTKETIAGYSARDKLAHANGSRIQAVRKTPTLEGLSASALLDLANLGKMPAPAFQRDRGGRK